MGVYFALGKSLPLLNTPSISKESWVLVSQVSAEDFYKRGLDKAKRKDFERAITDFTQAIRFKPNYPEAYYERALARYQPNEDGEVEGTDYEGAIKDLTQAIRLKPNYAQAYYHRGDIRTNSGDETGIEDFNQAIRLNPNYVEAYYSRASLREVELQT